MKCPHCQRDFHAVIDTVDLGFEGKTRNFTYGWKIHKMTCPACHKPILFAEYKEHWGSTVYRGNEWMIYPKGANRPSAPAEVPEDIARDFNEACLVLNDSPQASAALSRRCLQHLLHERNVSTNSNLSRAIDDALNANLPSHISEDLDAIRNIGNFAAHPQKSQQSGEILPVEPHEADWNLDVLEMLFDYYYVQPRKSAERRAALNEKLSEAGKGPMKEPGNEQE